MDDVINTFDSLLRPRHVLDFTLKPEQAKCIDAVLRAKDVLAVLPTGFGKSACYYVPPFILDELCPETRHTALVVSPLKSLMSDQVKFLKDHNIPSTCITSMDELDPSDVQGLRDGIFTVVFISLEASQSGYWKKVFLSETWQRQVCLVAIDESHCVSQWGEDFRPEYRKLSILRSFFDQPFMALSATMTNKIKQDVDKFLVLNGPVTIAVLPDRPNIAVHIEKSHQKYEEVLEWVVEYLMETTPKKMIIFCRSIYTTSEIFAFLVDSLAEAAYDGYIRAEKRKVEMFHSSLEDSTKEAILEKFKSGQKLKCLVSTIAFGMGINIPDIRVIVNWGAPSSLLQYWQQVGRCSRDGKPGLAVCYAFPRSLVSAGDEVKDLVSTQTCKRSQVLGHFILDGSSSVEDQKVSCSGCEGPLYCRCYMCVCCSSCKAQCKCSLSNVDIKEIVKTL